MESNRRNFLRQSFASASALAAASMLPADLFGQGFQSNNPIEEMIIQPGNRPAPKDSIRFSVIGINHNHILGMVDSLTVGGGQLVAVYAKEPELLAGFTKRYPTVKVAKSETEILEDNSIQLVACAAIPVDRAPIGIRVMKSGKDFMTDKPGILTFDQLKEVKKVQKETKRIYSIVYSERLTNRASVQAGELVQAGAIGKVVQTLGIGPHKVGITVRPDWFWDPEKAGGILCDIGSHQCDQFLYYTNSKQADVSFSQVGNFNNPNYPKYCDFGDMAVRSPHATGYIRIDWFTPDGLATWGDGRMFILGTEGYIEMRKYKIGRAHV